MKRWIHAATYNGFDESDFDKEQLEEIKKGLRSGLDISWYADPKFDDFQMCEIRDGLEKGLDVSQYADPKFDWKQMKSIRLRLPMNHTKTPKWSTIINQLQDDYREDLDPFYEQTEAAEYITSICNKVEEKLGIWLEPSIQGGQGGIWIYDKNDNVIAEGIDFESFNDEVGNLAINSKNKTEFASKYKNYLEGLIA